MVRAGKGFPRPLPPPSPLPLALLSSRFLPSIVNPKSLLCPLRRVTLRNEIDGICAPLPLLVVAEVEAKDDVRASWEEGECTLGFFLSLSFFERRRRKPSAEGVVWDIASPALSQAARERPGSGQTGVFGTPLTPNVCAVLVRRHKLEPRQISQGRPAVAVVGRRSAECGWIFCALTGGSRKSCAASLPSARAADGMT